MKITSILFFLVQFISAKVINHNNLILPVKSSGNYLKVNLTKTIYHQFSSKTKLDKFQISLTGNTILSGKVNFIIYNSLGKSIYKDSFDARYLIDYGINDDYPSVKKEEIYIEKRFSAFFDGSNFEQPAIKKSDKFDKDYSEERKVWEEIKADPSSVGFTYLTGEENYRSLTWSKQQQKVIIYFSCC